MSKRFAINCGWEYDWTCPTTPEQHAILAAKQAHGMKSHGPPGSHDGTNDGSGEGWAPAGTPAPEPMVFAVDVVPTMDEIYAACAEELARRAREPGPITVSRPKPAKAAKAAKPAKPKTAKSKPCGICGEADKRDCGCAPARHWWN